MNYYYYQKEYNIEIIKILLNEKTIEQIDDDGKIHLLYIVWNQKNIILVIHRQSFKLVPLLIGEISFKPDFLTKLLTERQTD